MTIATELRRAGPFTGNGVAVSFPFGFKVFAPGDVLVVRTTAADGDQTLDLTADYSVTLAADQNAQPGGSVTLTAPLVAGAQLTILSQVAALQPTELTNQGGFYPQVLTRAFDRATILIQQLAERVSRSLVLSPTEGAVSIPAPSQRTGGRILGFNRDTGVFEVQDGSAFTGNTGPANSTYTTLTALKAAAATNASYIFAPPSGSDGGAAAGTFLYQTAGAPYTADGVNVIKLDAVPLSTGALVRQDASGISFTPRGTGAMTVPAQAKMDQIIAAGIEHGIKNDDGANSGTDNSAKLNTLLAWAGGLKIEDTAFPGYGYVMKGGATVVLPAGAYRSDTATLEIPQNVSLRGEGNHSSVIRSNFNGPILRNEPTPTGPGGYDREGTRIESFGIIGNRAMANQDGLSLLRWTSSVLDNVHISECGRDGVRMFQCGRGTVDELMVVHCVGRGLYMAGGLDNWADATPDPAFPGNGTKFGRYQALQNGKQGLHIAPNINGAVFDQIFTEYNGGNLDEQILIDTATYAPIVLRDWWTEGQAKTHIRLNNTDAQVIIEKVRHFATDMERAAIVDAGALLIRDGFMPSGHVYPVVGPNGSSAPFRVRKGAGVIEIIGHRGGQYTRIGLVEDENGSQVGLFNEFRQENFDANYGVRRYYNDSGAATATEWYTDTQRINPYMRVGVFDKRFWFGDGSSPTDSYFAYDALRTRPKLFSALPAATTAGIRTFITDSTVAAAGNYGATAAGGGTFTVPVFSDGSTWRIG